MHAVGRDARPRDGVMRVDPVTIVAGGVVTPIGADLDTFWAGLVDGRDGISTIERFRVDDLRVGRAGEIKHALDDKDGRARPVAGALYDSPGHALARYLGARGPELTVSTACASGATALGVGAEWLRDDRADLVVAGGFDGLCRFVMRGFDALRSLTRERVRPFDRRRSGLLLGEGAGLVLMAREADARGPRLGRLLGHASASDGSHLTAPAPDGRGLEFAVRAAMDEAGVAASDVDFVSAH